MRGVPRLAAPQRVAAAANIVTAPHPAAGLAHWTRLASGNAESDDSFADELRRVTSPTYRRSYAQHYEGRRRLHKVLGPNRRIRRVSRQAECRCGGRGGTLRQTVGHADLHERPSILERLRLGSPVAVDGAGSFRNCAVTRGVEFAFASHPQRRRSRRRLPAKPALHHPGMTFDPQQSSTASGLGRDFEHMTNRGGGGGEGGGGEGG